MNFIVLTALKVTSANGAMSPVGHLWVRPSAIEAMIAIEEKDQQYTCMLVGTQTHLVLETPLDINSLIVQHSRGSL